MDRQEETGFAEPRYHATVFTMVLGNQRKPVQGWKRAVASVVIGILWEEIV